jgi:hypothetical protein
MIEEAKKLFASGREKDAYEMISYAVRFFWTHKLGHKREMTMTQTLHALKQAGLPINETKKCLDACGMVEFAKYKANRADFGKCVEIAERIIQQ